MPASGSLCYQVHDNVVNPVLSGHSKRRPKIGYQDRLSLNEGQKYCRIILQYFRPSLKGTATLMITNIIRKILINHAF